MSETVKKIVYVRKRALSNADSDTENEKKSRGSSVKKEPISQEPKIQPLVEKKVNIISTYFEAKKKEKNEFLMSGIMDSLEENEGSVQTKTVNTAAVQVKK